MFITDFEYDNLLLSDFGCVICSFDSPSLETVSIGSNITFNTVPVLSGVKHILSSTQYNECITSNFQICKNPCNNTNQSDMYFSINEITAITRWLNRKEFLKFRMNKEGYETIYFDASFNISEIKMENKTIGLELNLITNRPFAYEIVKKNIEISRSQQSFIFKDSSDEIGFNYPKMKIECKSAGDLVIYNHLEDRSMEIKNCRDGEIITIQYPVISSSISFHKIQNDFNHIFFRIANNFKERENKITVSLPCKISIEYKPLRKVGV